MSIITDRCETTKGLIKFAREVKEVCKFEGETFWFAPVDCREDQVDDLSEKGFHTYLHADGRIGLCWQK